MRSQLILTGAVFAAAIAWQGCTEITCGAGTVERDGVCVPDDAGADAGPGGSDAGSPDAGVSCVPACGAGFLCDQGLCVRGEVPSAWRCLGAAFADGTTCDCDCGVPDPDCVANATTANCLSGRCEADGACTACVPDCSGQQCGSDGCGGDCGTCTDPTKLNCIDGACVGCTPDCTDRDCGNDGCGGSCGTCRVGRQCVSGECKVPADGASCLGLCGLLATSGCSCEGSCVEAGTCCADVAVCGCLPRCLGRECGPDGCGGACGRCATGQLCGETGFCVDDKCDPDPCNGHGDCNPDTAACTCDDRFAGLGCNACAPGFTGYPDCQ